MLRPAKGPGVSRAPPVEGGTCDEDRVPLRHRAKRRALAVVVVVLAASVVVAAVGPVATSIAKARARSRGVELGVGSAWLGWGSIHFSDVTLGAAGLNGIDLRLARVELFPNLLLGARRIEIHGGQLRLDGSYEALKRSADAFRLAHGVNAVSTDARSDGPSIHVDGIDLVWLSAPGASDTAFAWGVSYDRTGAGGESVAVNLVRLSVAGVGADVARGHARIRREGGHRVLVASDAERLTAVLDFDALSGGTGEARPAAPVPRDEPEPDGTTDSEARRGPRLREKIQRVAAAIAEFLPSSGKVELPRAGFRVRSSGETLNFGPGTVALTREPGRVRLAVTSGAGDGRTPLELDVSAPTSGGAVDVALAGGPLPLVALGVREGDMGFENVDRAEIEVNGRAHLSEDGQALSLSGHSRISDLSVREPRLAEESVKGLRISLGGNVTVALDGTHVALEGVEIGLAKVKMLARGSLDRVDGHAKTDLHLEVPLAACSDMLAGTPGALIPLLSGLEMSGTFALAGDVSFDTRKLNDVKVNFTTANGCRITQVPDALSPARFRAPWTRSVLGADGAPTLIESGPGSSGWVPLFDVSPYVATSVVVCEDAHFFTHDGFDGKSIQDSIRDDLRAGKFVRGGSTVSMQLAKNLYLGREKTVSRKLEEAVLTLLLEQTLDKPQILELYLNVVEFGPGIYGIGPAASHYFRTIPKALSLAQALYLVSLLPNPKVHHFSADGTLRASWAEYLRHLMRVAHKIHRISDAELETGLAETVQFGSPAHGLPSETEPSSGEGSASPDVLEMEPRGEPADGEGP